MKIYGIIGWQNSGKTTLVESLVSIMTGRGLSVSTVKHVHHDVDLDQPGKDTWRHRAAGAQEVVLASAHRFAILREHRGPEPDLASVLARLAPVDLVLVEGYKRDAHPKIEIHRAANEKPWMRPDMPGIVAVASDVPPPYDLPRAPLDDVEAVADLVLAHAAPLAAIAWATRQEG